MQLFEVFSFESCDSVIITFFQVWLSSTMQTKDMLLILSVRLCFGNLVVWWIFPCKNFLSAVTPDVVAPLAPSPPR